MNVLTRVTLLSMAAAVVGGDMSQSVAEEPPATVSGLQMTVKLDRAVTGAGDLLRMEVIIENTTKQEISLGMSADDLCSFEFVVKYTGGGMAQGDRVPMTRYGAEIVAAYDTAKNIELRLKPGQKLRYDFPLNLMFDLTASGTYTVTIKRYVPGKARYDGVGQPLPPEANAKFPPELVSLEQKFRIERKNGVVRSLLSADADSNESDGPCSN